MPRVHSVMLLISALTIACGVGTPAVVESGSSPLKASWTSTGSMATARYGHTATLLPDGRVLVAAGDATGASASAEVYDPATGTWSATGSMSVPRGYHVAALLRDGRVLVAALEGFDGRFARG